MCFFAGEVALRLGFLYHDGEVDPVSPPFTVPSCTQHVRSRTNGPCEEDGRACQLGEKNQVRS